MPTATPTIPSSLIGASKQRCVAEPLLQSLRAAEHAAEVADVLAEHDDPLVALHRDRVRVADRLDHRHRRHVSTPPADAARASGAAVVAKTSSNIVAGLAGRTAVERPVRLGLG